jgi:hypothetical protein
MIPNLALAFLFFYLRASSKPDLTAIENRAEQNKVTALDMHIAMRHILPVFSFGAAGNVALIMAILSGFGVSQEDPAFALAIITTIAGFSAGLLMRYSIQTAKYLVLAEAGTPSSEHRDKLMADLVIFPLLPLAVTLAF